MTTDRELLEGAAKAAGVEVRNGRGHQGDMLFVDVRPTDGKVTGREWNPLADDGDALRLAVKLNIQIIPGTYNKDEFSAFKAAGGEAHEYIHFQQDEYAATRRAIVRAAYEIGKEMK